MSTYTVHVCPVCDGQGETCRADCPGREALAHWVAIEVVPRSVADELADALGSVSDCCSGRDGIPGVSAYDCPDHDAADAVLAKYRKATHG